MRRPYARAPSGVRALGHVPKNWGDSITVAAGIGSGAGCSGACSGLSGVGGSSNPTAPGPPGTLEIYSVSDECITGRVQWLTTGQIAPPPPSLDGAFHAVRCGPAPGAAGEP
jgi:hypothetical protein